jgi:hypothetical protein
LFSTKKPVVQGNRERARDHHGDQGRRREGRHEPEGDQRASEELGASRRPGLEPAWPQADLLEFAGGACDALAAKNAEQLLRTVRSERESDYKTKSQQCDLHELPPS